ncbi:unnamed protein product [Diabrotica balteata]|uniref:Uncharacterized protein n=1 Tax=Diabrotica balteata TaxID=107213 RepID=A0A9N9SRA1_DIABA|nr:unnamed protein product [Diabrotica balteata]
MFAGKIILLLGLATFTSAGKDLDTGYEILRCANKAMRVGVPELGVPPHDPYVAIRNLSWTGDIGVASTSVDLNTLRWAGLSDWDISAKQINDDADDEAVFDYTTYWPIFTISGKYAATVKELFLTQHYKGDFKIVMEKPKWTGRIQAGKIQPNATVDSFTVDWHVADVDVSITGLGLIGDATALAIQEGIETALNTGLIGNTVGDFLKMRFNTVWYPTGKLWVLMDWCNANSSTSAVPSTVTPVTDAPSTATPPSDAPVTDAPVTDAPVTDAPVTDAPSTAEPETDAPVTDASVTDAPVTDEASTAAPSF